MIDIKVATDRIHNRVHTTGEEIKNDLPNWVERVIKDRAWSKVVNPSTNKPFENVGQWLTANYPLGPGMGQSRYSIKYDEFISLCEDRPKLKDLLVKHRPKGTWGGDRKSKKAKIKMSNTHLDGNKPKKTNTGSRLYIEERLQRDHKDIWKQYLNGGFKSARQAGIAAGFVKDTHDPLMRLKANWNKASKKQRNEFLSWIESQ